MGMVFNILSFYLQMHILTNLVDQRKATKILKFSLPCFLGFLSECNLPPRRPGASVTHLAFFCSPRTLLLFSDSIPKYDSGESPRIPVPSQLQLHTRYGEDEVPQVGRNRGCKGKTHGFCPSSKLLGRTFAVRFVLSVSRDTIEDSGVLSWILLHQHQVL